MLLKSFLQQHSVFSRVVTRRGKGAQFPERRITMGALNHCGGRRKVPTMSQVLSSIHTFASERPHIRTLGHQTCILPRAPSNLVTPLVVVQ